MDTVPWNRVILDEFFRLALLSELEENIVRTRVAGWSQVRQCHEFNISSATLTRIVRKLKCKYRSCCAYSNTLPENLRF